MFWFNNVAIKSEHLTAIEYFSDSKEYFSLQIKAKMAALKKTAIQNSMQILCYFKTVIFLVITSLLIVPVTK